MSRSIIARARRRRSRKRAAQTSRRTTVRLTTQHNRRLATTRPKTTATTATWKMKKTSNRHRATSSAPNSYRWNRRVVHRAAVAAVLVAAAMRSPTRCPSGMRRVMTTIATRPARRPTPASTQPSAHSKPPKHAPTTSAVLSPRHASCRRRRAAHQAARQCHTFIRYDRRRCQSHRSHQSTSTRKTPPPAATNCRSRSRAHSPHHPSANCHPPKTLRRVQLPPPPQPPPPLLLLQLLQLLQPMNRMTLLMAVCR